MKRLFTIFTILAAVILVSSCQKDLPDNLKNVDVSQGGKTPTPTPTPTAELKVSEPGQFGAKGGQQTITITASEAWTLIKSAESDWLTIKKTSGKAGTTQVDLEAKENTETKARTATITVSSGNLTKNVEISQSAANSEISLSVDNLSFTSGSGSKSFSIKSNIAWTVSSSQVWCSVSPKSGSSDGSVSVSVEENTSLSERTATITVESEAGSQTVKVIQSGAEPVLQLNKNDLSFTSNAGSDSFTITSNTSWIITSDQTWCMVSSSSGSDNAIITVNVTENESTFSRSATITVKAGDMSKTIAITQTGANPEYFWLGNTMPTSDNFPTQGGKEVPGIVTTYTSLAEAMEKASRVYAAGEWAVVMYPLKWGIVNDLVFLDSTNKKYYATKQKNASDFPTYFYYESSERIGANTTITLSTESAAKAAGATLYVKPDPTPTPVYPSTRTFTANGVSFKMICVDGGTFTMGATSEQGSDAYDNEKPAHQVTLSSYYIGETEVTQELWQAVMGSNPSYFSGSRKPVEQVSWDDCQEFIRKLNSLTGQNFRLPTEAEWEFAARGGNQSRGYKYAGSNTIGNVAWYWDNIPSQSSGNSGYGTQNVATKQANEFGIYDMSGNVWEWCQDWYGGYSSSSQTNPTGPTSGDSRVGRGSSWYDGARFCRVSFRYSGTPSYRGSNVGLRLAL